MKRLFRERRRLVVVAAVTFLGGFIAFFHRTDPIFGIPFSVFAGLAFMFGLTTFLMILVLLFPKIRHSAEAVALSIPILSLMGAFGQADDGGLATSTSIHALLFTYLFMAVYAGAWIDRYLPRRPKTLTSFTKSLLRPEELWPYLTTTPDTFDDYGSEDTISMEWIEPGVSFRQMCRSGDLAKVEETHKIEVFEPYKTYRFSFDVPDAPEAASASRGWQERRLNGEGRGTGLETSRAFDRISIRARLFLWIDDGMGRLDDEVVQSIEARHRSKPGGPAQAASLAPT